MTATTDKSVQRTGGPAWPVWLRRLGEIASCRDLGRNLVSRDLKVRYRESSIGFG